MFNHSIFSLQLISIKKLLLSYLAIFITAIEVNANEESHFYTGIGLGSSFLTVEDASGNEDDQSEFSGQVFAGWKFSENFSLEVNYADLGEFDLPADKGIEYKAYGAQLNGYYPLSKKSRVYALLGGSTVNTKGVGVSVDKKDNSLAHIGLGYELDVTKKVFSRIEWKRFNEDAYLATLNIGYKFSVGSSGSRKSSLFERKVERSIKNNPTASAPYKKNSSKYASENNNSVLLKGKYLTDVRFESNSSDLSVLVHSQLDTAAKILMDDKNSSVILYGYTDSKGSKKYNKKMSKRRIDSVVKYLVGQGVKNDRIETHFLGERGPIASNKTEEGRAKNRRVRIQIVE